LRRFLDRLYAAAAAAAAVCLVLIGVVMLAQAVGRSFGILIRGADDVTGWLCAAAAFLALGHTFRHGELVRVGLWLERLGSRGRRSAELFSLGVALCTTAYMLWAIVDYVYGNWRDKYMTQGLLVIPEWIPQVSLVIGVSVFLVALADESVRVLGRQKPSYQVEEEARRAAGDFSETV
jgi:TRAP-type C4-dicarboxylate transport system permease small subunit